VISISVNLNHTQRGGRSVTTMEWERETRLVADRRTRGWDETSAAEAED